MYQEPRHYSGQALESWPGLQRRLRSGTCRPWSRQQRTACWVPWAPEEVEVSKSLATEYCPLRQRKVNGETWRECVKKCVACIQKPTFGVLGTSTH